MTKISKNVKWVACVGGVLLCTLFFVMLMGRNEISSATAIGEVQVNGYLNVRKGPGKSYGFVTSGGAKVTLSDGKRVTITAKNGKWYHVKFKMGGKTLVGYLHSSYVKVQTGNVRTSIPGKTSANSLKLYKKASIGSDPVKVDGVVWKIVKGTSVKILSEKVIGAQKWYYVSVLKGTIKCKGYLRATHVKVTYKKGMPGKVSAYQATTLYKKAGKSAAVKSAGKAVGLKKNKQVTVISEKIVKGVRYYRVSVRIKKKTVKGYLPEHALLFQIVKYEEPGSVPPAATSTPKIPTATAKTPSKSDSPADTAGQGDEGNASLTTAQFKKKMQTLGFPNSYITALAELHKKYPKWDFKPFKTGLNWSDAVAAESKVGLNLLSNGKSYDWKSLAAGAYDWTKDAFIPYDGSTWVTASEKAVKYYMDPRNFLDERGIFQFEMLEYQSAIQTQSGVENILKNTPMYQTSFSYTNSSNKQVSIKYSKAFMNAAASSKVSPYHLASRVKQEVVISPTMMSSSVSGNVSGYKGIFNFYNIGASNSTVAGGAVANGLHWASSGKTYSRPWNNRYRSITGGAKYIGEKYINVGQNTLYLQKFNVTSKNRYNHQYMANIEAPNSEASKTVTAYGTDKANTPFVFSIPVYNNMPSSVCPVPSGGKNPNNYLKTLYVLDHPFTSQFKLGDTGSKTYKVTVANGVTSIKICATKVSSSATLTGAGTKTGLKVGTNNFTVKVKSASGVTRSYKIQVTRKAAAKKAAKKSATDTKGKSSDAAKAPESVKQEEGETAEKTTGQDNGNKQDENTSTTSAETEE